MPERLTRPAVTRPAATRPAVTRPAVWRFVGLTLLATALLFGLSDRSSAGAAEAVAQSPNGAQLYSTHCAGCHQPTGLGIAGTFPQLAGNPAATDADYVTSVITDGQSGPLVSLGVEYDAAMPAVPALTGDDLDAVVAYVVELAGGDATAPVETAPEAAEPVVGDIDRGHDMFIGRIGLDGGGAACSSCHTAGSVGNLGGSSLGPDLTNAYETLGGEPGLTAWLGNPASPTMVPIFDHPLTEPELADLVAFFADAPSQDKADNAVDWLLVAAASGFIILVGAMALAWRGMRQTYVSRLRSSR